MEKTITMMICCPMRGLDNDQIRHSLMELQTFIIDEYNKYEHEVSIKFTDNFVNYSCPMLDHDDNGFRMFCLGNGIANVMAGCDVVVFAPGWHLSRGCLAEAVIAKLYKKQIIAVDRNVESSKLYVTTHDTFMRYLKNGLTTEGIKYDRV